MGDNIFVKIIFFFFLIILFGVPALVTNTALPNYIRFSGVALAAFCIYGFAVGFKNRKTAKGKGIIILSFLSWFALGVFGIINEVV